MSRDFSNEFKITLQLEGERSLSANDLFTLLENIMLSGSISSAAVRMGASYRYCWGLLQEAEKTLGLVLVDKQVGGVAGGGTSLTSQGKELLAQYKAFKQEADSQLKHFLARTSKTTEETGVQTSVRHLLLASTMEAVETGLMDLLEEAFWHTSGILVRHISAGSGRALQIAREGRVDMVLSHAPELEKAFMDEGWGIEMFPIMANDFVIAGSLSDHAGLGDLSQITGAAEAFKKIASACVPFISRGDSSGTHMRELEIWKRAGIVPEGEWYLKSSGVAGNLGALRLAREKQGYTLVDRASFLLSHEETMGIFSPGEKARDPNWNLENIFVAIMVNPERVPWVKLADARLFARWLRGKEGQELISSFGRESFGTSLFSGVP
jgi:tungstate transport system substrate-binding protein